ncbi:MAG: DUF1080 domain-containing protein, partial [Planctomycetota bacterium]
MSSPLSRLTMFLVCASAVLPLMAQDAVTSGIIESPTPLFNGKDLSNWKGRPDLWSIEDGAIVGRTNEDAPLDGNTFLVWTGATPANFELVVEFKIEGGNSGIQYRSRVIDEDKYVVSGYQADIDHANKFAGILYEEKARGILTLRGEKVEIQSDGKKKKES